MKKRRLLFLILIFALLLSACGSSYSDTRASETVVDFSIYDDETNSVETAEAGIVSDEKAATASTPSSVRISEAKLIYTGEMSIQTTDLTQAVQSIETLITRCGGYIERRNSYTEQSDFTIRVPQDQFDYFMSTAGEQPNCRVLSLSTQTEDIGEQYADVENRLETLNVKLERLQTLLTQAESMDDIISIESALSDTESEIEQLTGQKNHYDNLINFSTITLSVWQVSTLDEGIDPTFSERLSSGFLGGLSKFGTGFVDLVIWCASNLIPLIICGALATVSVIFLRRRRKKKSKPAE